MRASRTVDINNISGSKKLLFIYDSQMAINSISKFLKSSEYVCDAYLYHFELFEYKDDESRKQVVARRSISQESVVTGELYIVSNIDLEHLSGLYGYIEDRQNSKLNMHTRRFIEVVCEDGELIKAYTFTADYNARVKYKCKKENAVKKLLGQKWSEL